MAAQDFGYGHLALAGQLQDFQYQGTVAGGHMDAVVANLENLPRFVVRVRFSLPPPGSRLPATAWALNGNTEG